MLRSSRLFPFGGLMTLALVLLLLTMQGADAQFRKQFPNKVVTPPLNGITPPPFQINAAQGTWQLTSGPPNVTWSISTTTGSAGAAGNGGNMGGFTGSFNGGINGAFNGSFGGFGNFSGFSVGGFNVNGAFGGFAGNFSGFGGFNGFAAVGGPGFNGGFGGLNFAGNLGGINGFGGLGGFAGKIGFNGGSGAE